MKNNLMLLLCGLVLAFALGQFASAQTPDGQTPADEMVCDPLRADGVTKGLYGLCVAFCEAQDWTEPSDPITEAELEALADAAPSGKILANYNKKREEGDPAMPCIVVEEPCPCWSADELASLDGYAPDGSSLNLNCVSSSVVDRAIEFISGGYSQFFFTVNRQGSSPLGACRYQLRDEDGAEIRRALSAGQGTLTFEQAEACGTALRTRCSELSF